VTSLLVCSGGGHLKQLWSLRPRLDLDDEVLWVTFDTGLSRSLLADEDVVFAPYASPRDVINSAKGALLAEKLMRSRAISRVVSTGASLAVSFFPSARVRRIPCHYIESATRSEGPSLAGRIVARIPGVHVYTQYPALADHRWKYVGALFDGYRPGPSITDPPASPRKIVVTLGTTESYDFRRLVDKLEPILPRDAEVLWQTGSTNMTGSSVPFRETVPAEEMTAAIAEADLVIAHCGTGSAITAMDAGKCAVLVPRMAAHNEHIDDHQSMTAAELDRRGLVVRAFVEDLNNDVFLRAMRRSVEVVPNPPPFPLVESKPR